MNTDIKLIYDGIGKWYVFKGTKLKGKMEVIRKRLPTADGLVTFADRYYATIGKTRLQEEHFEDIVQQVFSLLSEPQLTNFLPVKEARCACCGTTERLHEDHGSGGPYRCDSPDCIVF